MFAYESVLDSIEEMDSEMLSEVCEYNLYKHFLSSFADL